jgi:hypothetical protein
MRIPTKGLVLTVAANPFREWAAMFKRHFGLQLVSFNAGASAKAQVLSGIRKASGPLDVIAYFGHAWITSLMSAGIGLRDIPSLAAAIRARSAADVIVVLYCCGTGTRGGFAEKLQLAIGSKAVVYGHEKAMSANVNPYKRRYPKGEYVVAPTSPLWCKWLQTEEKEGHSGKSTLWMRYAFMTEKELNAELDKVTTPATMKTFPLGEAPSTYACPR